jgi:hypothetical protein
MSHIVRPPFLWIPSQGPDSAALDRMTRAFRKPTRPMGEAWFMSPERKMYPRLSGDLDALSDEELEEAIEEIATGSSSFGPFEEWTEWYHYLLPRLVSRRRSPSFYNRAELLMTAFMVQHPASDGDLPYRAFQTDTLDTLGRYVMSSQFWPDAQRDAVQFPGTWLEGLFSASLFFCVKYLARTEVEPWFRSVIGIPNDYWRLYIIAWLVGAHPILSGVIGQPSEFPERGWPGIGWSWSHILNGNYSGNHQLPIQLIPFLPVENRETILRIAGGEEVERLVEDILTDPHLEAAAGEMADVLECLFELYRPGSAAS